MNKEEIRKNMKYLRNKLSQEEIKKKSNAIQTSLLELLQNIKYDSLFIYNSFKSEVSTKELIKCLYTSKNVYLPKITENKMYTIHYTKSSILEKNSFGIEEPTGHHCDIDNFVCILPLLAVDNKGNRIGFGKGYYDKFLENKNCIKIGLCYDFQIIKGIPYNKYDIPLDIIISEKRIIKLIKI